jgi:small-conductance mechanosensitive channel
MDRQTRLTELLHVRLFSIGETDFTVGSAVAVASILVVTYVLARALRRVAGHHLRRRGVDDDITLQTTATVLQLVVWLVGIEVVLHILGIRLATLFATTGFLALGAGFGIKSVVENWISGVILRVGQTIRPGDLIVVRDQWLQIKRIGLRTTDALTFSNEEVIIPNSIIAQSIVTNLTRHDTLFRLDAKVGVSYDSDLDAVRRTLETTLNDLEWRSTKREPAVYLTEFGDSSVKYTTHVWIDDVRHTLRPASDLHESIWEALKRAGIVIAYPQLDVHLDPPSGGNSE